ncbi:Protein of unknown function D [Prunus dulcis]|uniref:Uncharacterized protein n=1 Tax=Prunus dulcis TaxID=3755 RepID=A0A4Y1RPW9_PRUDU|nr:Protein of unknown function D [Prunus dulcis]
MDGVGRALLTLKPQMLSMQDQWNAYRGEDGCGKSPKSSRVFAMRSGLAFLAAATKVKQLRCSWELMQLAPQISELRVVLGDEIAKSEAAVDNWWPV